jgi:hypothetical protein
MWAIARSMMPLGAATLCLLLATAAQAQGVPQTQTRPASPGQPAACGCPVITPVATSDKPAPGRVSGELSLRDLELFMSNREARFDGDWDKAMLSLAHDIDPSGAMKMWSDPAPAPTRANLPVMEGGVTYRLLNGVDYTSAIRAKHLPYMILRVSDQTGVLMSHIVWTLARINKYGESEFGLRKALLSVAHFLINDLARKPPPEPRSATDAASRSRETTAWEQEAQSQGVLSVEHLALARPEIVETTMQSERFLLDRTIGFALPQYDERRATRKAGAFEPFEQEDKFWKKEAATLPLDDFDLANAALDIEMIVDKKGHPTSLLSYRYRGSQGTLLYDSDLIANLAGVAARRTLFGGSGPDNSSVDAVGCKAFAVLVALLDYRSKDSASWRSVVWSHFFNDGLRSRGQTPAALPTFLAQRAALILGGLADADKARTEAITLVGLADNWGGRQDKELLAVVPMINATTRDMALFMAGPAKSAFSDTVEKEWAGHRASADAGNDYRAPIQAWDASSADWTPISAQLVCAPPETPPRVLIFSQGLYDPILLDKLYQNIPLMLGVVFDEPYDGGSYPVSLRTSGGQIDRTARPTKENPLLFLTDQFVIKDR